MFNPYISIDYANTHAKLCLQSMLYASPIYSLWLSMVV